MSPVFGLAHLYRIRWAVRGALTLAVAASVAANVLHAQPNPVGRTIAAWPPLALLLTIELISRVPVHRRSLAGVRFAATASIAGIAAWVSYWHMVNVCSRYGESATSAHLVPLSVDGVVVVASVCLVEIAGRIRATEPDAVSTSVADTEPVVNTDTRPVVIPDTGPVVSADTRPDTATDSAPTGSRTRRRTSRTDTATAVARLRRRHPDMPTTDIAHRLGVTDRTVRRHLAASDETPTAATPTPVAEPVPTAA